MLLVGFGALAADTPSPRVHIRVREFAPPDWQVCDINTQSRPCGWDQTPATDSGLGVSLEGPVTVRGAKGEPAKECLTIYLMPRGPTPVGLPAPGTPLAASVFLGLTKHSGQVYVKAWSGIQTWPDWSRDMQKHLEVGPSHTSDGTHQTADESPKPSR